jgi:hypothetical protein
VTTSYSGLIDSLPSFVLMCWIELVMHFIGKGMIYKLASNYIATTNTTPIELIPWDYKH